jgi:glutamine cyclotransferase
LFSLDSQDQVIFCSVGLHSFQHNNKKTFAQQNSVNATTKQTPVELINIAGIYL